MSAKGRPATSMSALGSRSVSGRMRVPKPPDSTTQGSISAPHHHGGAVEVELEADLGEALPDQSVSQLLRPVRIEEEEAAGAGTDQLAAQGAVRHGHVVPTVDVGRRHAFATLSLVL